MAQKDYYLVDKNTQKIIQGSHTNFLDPILLKKVCTKLKNVYYNIYYPYEESDKAIIYTSNIPIVRVFEILSYDKLSHREIMGSLFNMNINTELFGSIIVYNNHYYILVMDSIANLLKNAFNKVGRHHIKIEERSLELLKNVKKKYEKIEFVVSSCRIDNIVSNLIGTSRKTIKKFFLNDYVILNYEVCHKINYVLEKNDVFSIRKYGKFKFDGIINDTRKGNYVIRCLKYIDS